jgi:hypothetical protein
VACRGTLCTPLCGSLADEYDALTQATGKEQYVFFSFPHIGIDSTGIVGNIRWAAQVPLGIRLREVQLEPLGMRCSIERECWTTSCLSGIKIKDTMQANVSLPMLTTAYLWISPYV